MTMTVRPAGGRAIAAVEANVVEAHQWAAACGGVGRVDLSGLITTSGESLTFSEDTGARREIVRIAADPATSAPKTTTNPMVRVRAIAAAMPPTRPAAGRVSNQP